MIKKGDIVAVIAGKDKGKQGKVLQVLPDIDRAQVEGVNVLTKHIKSKQKGTPGQRIQFPSPLHISNLQLICPRCGKKTRVGFSVPEGATKPEGSTKKTRMCKSCKEAI